MPPSRRQIGLVCLWVFCCYALYTAVRGCDNSERLRVLIHVIPDPCFVF